MDRNTLAANHRLNNPTVQEWCDQVVVGQLLGKQIIFVFQEDVLLLFPFNQGSKHISYDETSHRATIQDDGTGAHAASYSNASRVTTYLRGGVEQFHGGIKGTFKVIFSTSCNLC